MMYTFAGELPRHQYVWVDSRFTHIKPQGFIPAVWFAITSTPARMWGCSVMLESGAIYRGLPLHALASRERPVDGWGPRASQEWGCYGWQFSTIAYTYLCGLPLVAQCGNRKFQGEYVFTAAPFNDGFSDEPEQSKEFVFAALDNGRFTSQPTNRVVFSERSFTSEAIKFPSGLKRARHKYSVE